MRGVTTVVLGLNRFVDCVTLIALGNAPLLSVTTAPLRLTLVTRDATSKRVVHIVDNQQRADCSSEVKVIASDRSVSVFWNETPLATAVELDGSTVSLRADLRPVGINIFDDVAGLHLGEMHFAGHTIRDAQTVFQLG